MNFIINLKNAVRNLNRRGQHNTVKILCLGVGLAIGSVIIAKVYFEQSYDSFFPNIDRTYLINEKYIREGELKEYPQTSGAIAPGMKRYAPQIEAATRYTYVSNETTCIAENKNKYSVKSVILADSCFFDVLSRRILAGDPKKALSNPESGMISRSLAEKIGPNALGSKITFPALNITVTVGGIYEDIPQNSYLKDVDAIGSLNAYSRLSTENWVGNDRYISYIRLVPGTTTSALTPSIEKMMKENMDLASMQKSGVMLSFSFTPVTKLHTDDPTVKRMTWILSLLAFILIFSSIMNYLLIVIGNMIGRAKEMAVHKSYGAEPRNIHAIVFTESLVHLVLAIILAALLIFICKGTVEDLLDAPLSALLLNKGSWIIGAVCLLILFITGYLPGVLYSRIPVSAAFRGYSENRRRWKLSLLSIQFVAAGFLFSLLFVINRQYNLMVNDKTGYDYENLAYIDMSGAKKKDRIKAVGELQKSSKVESISASYELPTIGGASGNNVSLPGEDTELFNGLDLYYVSDNYIKTLGMKIIAGRNFTEHADSLSEVMVSRAFVEKMDSLKHWNGQAVGHQVFITGHGEINHGVFTICGVYENVRNQSLNSNDVRPSFLFYTKVPPYYILIRFHKLDEESMTEAQNTIKRLFPDKDFTLRSYRTDMINLYRDSFKFRNAVMISSIVTLIIALIGLIGYSNDEVNRRRKEIAIRKVNGAQVSDVLKIFLKDILRIALPSILVGEICSAWVGVKWLQQFAEKAPLNTGIFIGCGVAILAIILAAVNFNCYRVANSNPVDYLKGE